MVSFGWKGITFPSLGSEDVAQDAILRHNHA